MLRQQTVTQYSVVVPNEPGELARVTHLLTEEGVNLEGVISVNVGDTSNVQFVAGRSDGLRRRLEDAGLRVLENQVFHIQLRREPEELNRLATALCDDGINILSLYGNLDGELVKLVLAVDRPERAAAVLSRLRVPAAR